MKCGVYPYNELVHAFDTSIALRDRIDDDLPLTVRANFGTVIVASLFGAQVAKHDAKVLAILGGGSIHSCGKIDHVVEEFMTIPGCKSIDLGQPELNDLDMIYAMARQHQVSLIRVTVPSEQLVNGQVLKRFPTGVTLVHRATSFSEAQNIMKQYRESSEK